MEEKDSRDASRGPRPEHPTRTAGGRIPLAVIAERAGVSEATVSRVLNRRYGVAQATRESVESALRSLGVNQRTNASVVLVLTSSVTNTFFAAMSERIEAELNPYGLRTLLCSGFFDTIQERDHLDAIVDARIAAVIFLSSSNTLGDSGPVVDMIVNRKVPFLSVNSGFPDRPAPVVSVDDWQAVELAVNHLYSLGHRRLGLLAGPHGNEPAERRVEGFLQALDRRDILESNKDLVVRRHFTVEGGYQAATQLLPQGVTALVGSSDEMALGAIRAARRMKLNVPADISIVGIDDSQLLDFTDPPLTSVRQPVDRMAEHVATIVSAFINDREAPQEEIFVEPEFRLRASTAPAPAGRGGGLP